MGVSGVCLRVCVCVYVPVCVPAHVCMSVHNYVHMHVEGRGCYKDGLSQVQSPKVPGARGTTSGRGPAPFRAPPPLGTAYTCAAWSRTAHRFRLLGGRAEAARATREPAGRRAACEGPRGGEGAAANFVAQGRGRGLFGNFLVHSIPPMVPQGCARLPYR